MTVPNISIHCVTRQTVIALDSNIFIYMLEAHHEFGPAARDIFLAIEQTSLDATASELTLLEVLASPKLQGDAARQTQYSLEQLGVRFHFVSKEVLLRAAELRRQHGCGAFDSIHIAQAIRQGCSQFITNDKTLLKKQIPGIKLIPIQTPLTEIIANDAV